ncbi:hypothetical protein D9756_005607 [Leucocoprinus leucothites]|uniref:F-box domain-containing protein n=1 Tax=Leucocoprinus leucothites TaxID=201217 RepID=A0A8H5FZ48_9AGAR|nr:hypothetical protein D9756_005607 [Leucoagaricus leucothites]
MSSKLLALPDDVLGEILILLPALSILLCRQVCRKLNQLTKARHIWITVFNRTQYMFRPTINEPIKEPLSKLEMAIAQAEKLDAKFTSVNGVCAPPAHAYRLKMPSLQRRLLVIMGDYIVCLAGNYAYQWSSKRNTSLDNKSVVFEYRVPVHMDTHDGQKVPYYHLYQMDHDSNNFYVINGPDTMHEHAQWELVEIKLDGVNSEPYLSTRSLVEVNPRRRSIKRVTAENYVAVFYYKPDSGYGIDITIVDFRTKAVSHYHLVLPNPLDWEGRFEKHIYASNTHLLLIINSTDFYIFVRSSPEVESSITRNTLQTVTSGHLPSGLAHPTCQIFHQINPDSFIIVGALGELTLGNESTQIHFISFKEHSGADRDWTVEIEVKIIRGSHCPDAGRTIFAMPPNPRADYILAILSCRFFSISTDLSPETESITYQLLRIEGLNPDTTGKPPGKHINITRMDLKPWVVDRRALDLDLRCIDFDPFSGTALLVSPMINLGHQSIVVLDYLSKGETTHPNV